MMFSGFSAASLAGDDTCQLPNAYMNELSVVFLRACRPTVSCVMEDNAYMNDSSAIFQDPLAAVVLRQSFMPTCTNHQVGLKDLDGEGIYPNKDRH